MRTTERMVMKNPFQSWKNKPLESQIEEVSIELNKEGPDSQQYEKLLKYLERLTALKQQTMPKRVSRDTWISVGGSLLGMVLIMRFERFDVLTTKALNHLPRTNKPS
jgi:hypothetical protein